MKSDYCKFVYDLQNQLEKLYEESSVLAVDSYSKSYSVSKEGTSVIEHDLFTDRGIVIRVFYDGLYYEYSTNSIDVKFIIKELNKFVGKQKKDKSYCISEEKIKKHIVEHTTFQDYTDAEIIDKMEAIYGGVMQKSNKIIGCGVTYMFQRVKKLFVSRYKDFEQEFTWGSSSISVTAQNAKRITRSTVFENSHSGVNILELLEKKIDEVVLRATRLLEAKQIIPGNYECICSPAVSGLIAHEAIGHAVEMDTVMLNQSKAKEWFGEKIGSELVTIHDNGTVYSTGMYYFDDEGNEPQDTVIISNGVLVSGINDMISADSINIGYSGNGRRESFERKAYSRMTNTYFEGGHNTLDEMISSINYGFLIEEAVGGMEDPKNWGIQCVANSARKIVNGKLTDEFYSPVIMTGYVPDVLKSVSMVSKDVEFVSGMCGKGHKEWVEVSDGGPYIKVKLQLG